MIMSKYVDCFSDNSKILSFFKGEGEYFFRDPNWGGHLYYPPMSIVFDKINEKLIKLDDFLNGFYYFVSQIKYTDVDAEHFWQNIYAIYLCLNEDKNSFPDFFSKDYPCNSEIISYILRVKNVEPTLFFFSEIRGKFPQAGILDFE